MENSIHQAVKHYVTSEKKWKRILHEATLPALYNTKPEPIKTPIGSLTCKFEVVNKKRGESAYVFYLNGVPEQGYQQFLKGLIEYDLRQQGLI